jgi:hypothetical protein
VIAGALLLAAAQAGAAPATAVEAERAFAAEALRRGQWTAFRAWAAPDAVMFAPGPVDAQAWLRARADPVSSVTWQPAESFTSCDGATAINTGPWQQTDGHGYFTNVWARGVSGWRWLVDFSGPLTVAGTAGEPRVTAASCAGTPTREAFPAGAIGGSSADGTLRWWYAVSPDGGRTMGAEYWDGTRYRPALDDQAAG